MKSLKDFSDEELKQELENRENHDASDLRQKWRDELEVQAKIILEALESYNRIIKDSQGSVYCDTSKIERELIKADLSTNSSSWNSSGCSW